MQQRLIFGGKQMCVPSSSRHPRRGRKYYTSAGNREEEQADKTTLLQGRREDGGRLRARRRRYVASGAGAAWRALTTPLEDERVDRGQRLRWMNLEAEGMSVDEKRLEAR